MTLYENVTLEKLLENDGFCDGCGRKHSAGLKEAHIYSGAIEKLPLLVRSRARSKPFILADENTWRAAGEPVKTILEKAGINPVCYIISENTPEPNEKTAGEIVMHYNTECDLIIGVGSGVINDNGKLLAALTGNDYIIIATAPSMDGYASATSSMSRDRLKISLPTKCASAVIGDTDILRNAPADMLAAGVGDMVAKYISLCEWKISNIINGEYYCDGIAAIVRGALDSVVSNAAALAARDGEAVESVMRGLVVSGMAMNYAGVSRPASGIEHYFSHIWDMRGLEFGTPVALHGVQCGVATLLALKIYKQLRRVCPDREKALAFVASFDKEEWFISLRHFLGRGAEAMISAEERDGKYDTGKHRVRLERIISRWDEITEVIDTLPDYGEIEKVMCAVGAPTTPEELSVSPDVLRMTFLATKDVRDKYIASRLLWDMGEIGNIKFD